MSSLYNQPSYKVRDLKYKEITKVHGWPAIETIFHTYKQLKLNTNIVHTTLGDSQLGHLALFVFYTGYNIITNSRQFNKAVNPGIFKPIYAPIHP